MEILDFTVAGKCLKLQITFSLKPHHYVKNLYKKSAFLDCHLTFPQLKCFLQEEIVCVFRCLTLAESPW